jgi:DNA-directed RNA polymerase subunit N (RpoN/RPB10)
MSAELVWELYKKRADAENQIKELKYNYGMDGFCARSMASTEAAFRWVMVAYNLMSLFKQKLIAKKAIPCLSTLRLQCIAIGSYVISKGRNRVLKLAATGKKQEYLETLFVKLRAI